MTLTITRFSADRFKTGNQKKAAVMQGHRFNIEYVRLFMYSLLIQKL